MLNCFETLKHITIKDLSPCGIHPHGSLDPSKDWTVC